MNLFGAFFSCTFDILPVAVTGYQARCAEGVLQDAECMTNPTERLGEGSITPPVFVTTRFVSRGPSLRGTTPVGPRLSRSAEIESAKSRLCRSVSRQSIFCFPRGRICRFSAAVTPR